MAKNDVEKFEESIIRDRIYSIRGYQVMLDSDLAELYGVRTKRLNEAVKRNKERFPEEFCFLLKYSEVPKLRSQIATSNNDEYFVIPRAVSSKKGGRRFIPYVFTQEGVAMLSAVLKSETAVKMSIKIIKAFVEMRKYIQTNGYIFQRLDRVEVKLFETDQKVEKVLNVMESKEHIPEQGIFFEGQVFDAYNFVSDLFRSAENSIVIIDNYVDDTVLVHLTKVSKGIKVKILKKSISEQFKLDILKFSEQYFDIEVKEFRHSHDRFIIIDGSIVYLFGASLKDLGKKLFGFTKMDKSAMKLIDKIQKI